MKPVILWTDGLIFLLLAGILAAVPLVRRNVQMRAQWSHVFQSRLGMATAIILFAYLSIAMLDSLHFRPVLPDAGAVNGANEVHYAPRVLSVLDVIFGDLNAPTEKSYSRPFAAYAFSKENITLADGRILRDYPRLEYGARHLLDPSKNLARDVVLRSGKALGVAAGLWTLLITMFSLISALIHRQPPVKRLALMWRGEAALPWRTAFLTLLALCGALCWLYEMSRWYHVFGTDKVGVDVLYQTLKSVRTGVLIGLLTTLVMLPLAIALGVSGGYFGGLIDDVIQYIYTTLNSIPGVLLIAAAVLILQVYMNNHPELFETEAARSDMRLLFLCIILGVTSWTGLCRMLRAETLKLRSLDYVDAARAFGVKNVFILVRHILPNVTHIVLISIALDFSGLVLAEAVLSYVGVGVDPSMYSWGNMINSARLELAREPVVWWPLSSAFAFMFILVLAANLYADVVRDAFDPRSVMRRQ